MTAIEGNNSALNDVLPKAYARPALDKTRLGRVVDLVSNIKVGGAEAAQPPQPCRHSQSSRMACTTTHGRIPYNALDSPRPRPDSRVIILHNHFRHRSTSIITINQSRRHFSRRLWPTTLPALTAAPYTLLCLSALSVHPETGPRGQRPARWHGKGSIVRIGLIEVD